MKATLVDQFGSRPAPKEYMDIPEIKKARPRPVGEYVETSLQQLDGFPEDVILVQWMGAKNGFWYAASSVYRITKD